MSPSPPQAQFKTYSFHWPGMSVGEVTTSPTQCVPVHLGRSPPRHTGAQGAVGGGWGEAAWGQGHWAPPHRGRVTPGASPGLTHLLPHRSSRCLPEAVLGGVFMRPGVWACRPPAVTKPRKVSFSGAAALSPTAPGAVTTLCLHSIDLCHSVFSCGGRCLLASAVLAPRRGPEERRSVVGVDSKAA